MELGVQFYTLREQCKDLNGLAQALARVADIGYKTVQISGVCPYEPEWLRDELKKNGLRCVLTHTSIERLEQEVDGLIADHNAFDCRYVGLGCGPQFCKGEENLNRVLNMALDAGTKLHAAGKRLMYHIHAPEFTRDQADGKTRLDYLLDNTTPEQFGVTFDTYWVQAGGCDMQQWIAKLHDRIPCVHLKDMAVQEFEQRMAPVGEGNLNWARILPAFEAVGVEYALVEQDETYGEDPFACLKRSYAYLTAMGLK